MFTLDEIADRFGVDIHPKFDRPTGDRFLTTFHAALAEVCPNLGPLRLRSRRIDSAGPTVDQTAHAYGLALASIGREPLTDNEHAMGAALYRTPHRPNHLLAVFRLYDKYALDAVLLAEITERITPRPLRRPIDETNQEKPA